MRLSRLAACAALLLCCVAEVNNPAAAQMQQVPARAPGEGEGPYRKLVIRGVMAIPGNGAPPLGPVDIVIERNRIAEIRTAGTPGLPLQANREPRDADREIDGTGMWVFPGLVDTHGHNGDPAKAPNASYGYKLWLAHGVTSVRGAPFYFGDLAQTMRERAQSEANTIVAPRMYPYAVLGDAWSGGDVDTPAKAREWVRWAARQGFWGVKLFNNTAPATTTAAIDEARKLGLGTVAHLAQGGVSKFNARDAGRAGLGSITHFYGHFESLLKDRRLQTFPNDYNMLDEQSRFGEVASLADQIVEPGSAEWNAYLREQLERGTIFNPTLNIYSASRDVMRARNADWHALYTLPSLMTFFEPSREHHGSYYHDWTTAREIAWRRFYVPYMRLMNDYKNMGGLVTAGSDPGYIYQSWGFPLIGELEMLQEAGFSPLEAMQAATHNGAVEIYRPRGVEPPIGEIAVGKLADLVIVPENPLQNFKTLYGTGFQRVGQNGQVQRVGGVRYTIKDGIVYDARRLLADVAAMVAAEKARSAK